MPSDQLFLGSAADAAALPPALPPFLPASALGDLAATNITPPAASAAGIRRAPRRLSPAWVNMAPAPRDAAAAAASRRRSAWRYAPPPRRRCTVCCCASAETDIAAKIVRGLAALQLFSARRCAPARPTRCRSSPSCAAAAAGSAKAACAWSCSEGCADRRCSIGATDGGGGGRLGSARGWRKRRYIRTERPCAFRSYAHGTRRHVTRSAWIALSAQALRRRWGWTRLS